MSDAFWIAIGTNAIFWIFQFGILWQSNKTNGKDIREIKATLKNGFTCNLHADITEKLGRLEGVARFERADVQADRADHQGHRLDVQGDRIDKQATRMDEQLKRIER